MKNTVFVFMTTVVVFFYTSAYAGAFFIDASTVRLNGRPCGASFRAYQKITMSYRAEGYSFSGGNYSYEFFLFALVNKSTGERRYTLQLARDYRVTFSSGHWFDLDFELPGGRYKISYYRLPLFTSKNNLPNLLNKVISQSVLIKYLHNSYNESSMFSSLCEVNIQTGDFREVRDLSIFLRFNDSTPGTKKIPSNINRINFTFLPQNISNEKNLLFRYRLMPDESWSNWQPDNHANYYFINRGYHDFEVQCKYEKDGRVDTLRNPASYHFKLDETFIANPELSNEYQPGQELDFIDKGDIKQKTVNPDVILSRVYEKSKALMIGVDKFNDRTFEVLPFIKNDVNELSKALSAMSFEVHKSSNLKRDGILRDIRNELSNANKNDRVIIYISSHGFVDPISKKPLIATQECKKTDPVEAISIEELKDLIKGRSSKCRHILLILDCCASGLSIIEKNNSLGAIRTLATQNGTSILTAGMSNQNAKMDEKMKMSVFTYYLIEGLAKKRADYTKDGIITLSELLIYVQYNVAKRTNSQQVPMSGRISGTGEMIFY
jgi:hypothetical protein